MHRDISPGNVYAYAGEEPVPEGGEGFIADLQLARTPPEEPYPHDSQDPGPPWPIEIPQQWETRHMRPRPGPAMTVIFDVLYSAYSSH